MDNILQKQTIRIPAICKILFCILSFILFLIACTRYEGQVYIYVLFTIASYTLLYFGFRKNAIFFDAFIAVFIWLGFWFKLTYSVVFRESQFIVAVGSFDGSGNAFDYASLVSIVGILGFIFASCIREKYIFTYPEKSEDSGYKGLLWLYRQHRKLVLIMFVLLVLFVSVTNFYFGIYQRGTISRTSLPYGLNGVYTWLLLFGLASFSALILHLEFVINKKTSYTVVFISLIEGFITNISLLSRGMVINISALGYGIYRSMKFNSIKPTPGFFITVLFIFVILFGTSILVVNQLRYDFLKIDSELTEIQNYRKAIKRHESVVVRLIVDRWVGIEGVMAISSYPEKNWNLLKKAWAERFVYNKNSFYDSNIITSSYNNEIAIKTHSISLPGIIAFCFYPGSFLFLFGCMLLSGLIAALVELSVFRLGGKNIILCSLLAQVVAYRYMHFGYVPSQTHLLFGAIFLNLVIIFLADRILYWYQNICLNSGK